MRQRIVAAGVLGALLLILAPASAQTSGDVATVRVDVTPSHIINSFDPDQALGSSVDVLSHYEIDKVYTPHILEESLSAGWGPITYRNNTELRMAAWHWTENGTWSDPAHKSGYFTGSTDLKEPIRYILAYGLPHRGFSTSGDRPIESPHPSYWKSNPYLTSKFTGESDALHPQWVVMDLKSERPINALRIAWAEPYAKTYQVEYWVGKDALDFDEGPQTEWRTFPSGAVQGANSANQHTASFSGSVTQVSFGSEQYVWKDAEPNSYADPDGPPVGGRVAGGPQATFTLPKASVTVLRGRLDGEEVPASE
jgi:hypothetical protein